MSVERLLGYGQSSKIFQKMGTLKLSSSHVRCDICGYYITRNISWRKYPSTLTKIFQSAVHVLAATNVFIRGVQHIKYCRVITWVVNFKPTFPIVSRDLYKCPEWLEQLKKPIHNCFEFQLLGAPAIPSQFDGVCSAVFHVAQRTKNLFCWHRRQQTRPSQQARWVSKRLIITPRQKPEWYDLSHSQVAISACQEVCLALPLLPPSLIPPRMPHATTPLLVTLRPFVTSISRYHLFGPWDRRLKDIAWKYKKLFYWFEKRHLYAYH